MRAPGPDFILKGAGALTTCDWKLIVKRIKCVDKPEVDNPFFDSTLPELIVEKWSRGNIIWHHLVETILTCLISR